MMRKHISLLMPFNDSSTIWHSFIMHQISFHWASYISAALWPRPWPLYYDLTIASYFTIRHIIFSCTYLMAAHYDALHCIIGPALFVYVYPRDNRLKLKWCIIEAPQGGVIVPTWGRWWHYFNLDLIKYLTILISTWW